MIRISKNDVYIDRPKRKVDLRDIEKIEVVVPVIRKGGSKVTVDAITHMLSSSVAHGNEIVNVLLKLTMRSGETIEAKVNDRILTKNSLEYHACVKRARELENEVLKAKQR